MRKIQQKVLQKIEFWWVTTRERNKKRKTHVLQVLGLGIEWKIGNSRKVVLSREVIGKNRLEFKMDKRHLSNRNIIEGRYYFSRNHSLDQYSKSRVTGHPLQRQSFLLIRLDMYLLNEQKGRRGRELSLWNVHKQ